MRNKFNGDKSKPEYVTWLENYIELLENQQLEIPAEVEGLLAKSRDENYAKYYILADNYNYVLKAETLSVEITDPWVGIVDKQIIYNNKTKHRLKGTQGLIYCDIDGEHVFRTEATHGGIDIGKEDYKITVPQIWIKIVDPNLSIYATNKEAYIDYSSKYLR